MKMGKLVMLVAMFAVVAFVAPLAQADEVTIACGADSWLKYSSWNQEALNTNHGDDTSLTVGYPGGNVIMKFDLASVTGDITSATLNLYATYTRDKLINVYRMTNTDWVENEVLWNFASTDNAWTTPGGDYDNSLLASYTFQQADEWKYTSIDVTALVQAAKAAGQSYASFILLGSEGGVFSSKEGYDAPYLVVDQQVVPEPMTMTLLALGGMSLLARRRSRA